MELLQVLSPFCKVWITSENLREKSFISEVRRNALYHITAIRVLFLRSHSGMATEPRLGYCCLVFGTNAGNHRRKNKLFYFLMLVILVQVLIWKLNLEVTWKFPSCWWLPFIKFHFPRFLGKGIFSLVETQCFSLLISSVLNCCSLPLLAQFRR